MFEFKWRVTYFSSLREKLILAPLGMPKWVWPSMNRYTMLFVQTWSLLQIGRREEISETAFYSQTEHQIFHLTSVKIQVSHVLVNVSTSDHVKKKSKDSPCFGTLILMEKKGTHWLPRSFFVMTRGSPPHIIGWLNPPASNPHKLISYSSEWALHVVVSQANLLTCVFQVR